MKKKRIIFVSTILLISILCLSFMNTNYDKLSRYPYEGEESRELIKEHLNDDEIEYIIEYKIAPATFIAYIQEDGFNIYHASEYRTLHNFLWKETPKTIVSMVEKTRDAMDVYTLSNYCIHYSFDEILYWIQNGDKYQVDSQLITNAGNVNAYVDDFHTLSTRVPFNLQVLDSNIPTVNDDEIIVDVALQEPLKEMCQALSTEINSSKNCGGLLVSNGYISYEEQKKLYDDAIELQGENVDKFEFKPGHSEHQLGLSVDFVVDGIDNNIFYKTEQYDWLMKNAHRFGFVQTYKISNINLTNKFEQTYHFRYIGKELSSYLHTNNLSFSDIATN